MGKSGTSLITEEINQFDIECYNFSVNYNDFIYCIEICELCNFKFNLLIHCLLPTLVVK